MKKTNKENPLTTFRKLNQAREAVVMKSIKKAQDGIEMNDDMINKAGSTGGYKKPMRTEFDAYKEKFANEQYNSAREKVRDTLRNTYKDAIQKDTNRRKTDALNEMYPNYQIPPKKKGGVVKSKKK
jgi:helix-turn-helix protein